MGNPGRYGQRRFERLDYDESIAQGEIATTAVGTDQLKDENVTSAKIATTAVGTDQLKDANVTTDKVESELKTGQIVVQLGAGGGTHYITKPASSITLSKLEVFASVGAASVAGEASLSVTLKESSSGGATTATVSGGAVSLSATTANLVMEASTSLSATIEATQGLYLVAGATTLVDDNASAIIQYTVD